MKRLIILSVLSLTVTTSFAYYSSVDYELSGLPLFFFMVMLAWGILEIILFFKIWGMTNNIKAVKKDYFNEVAFDSDEQMASYVRKNLILNNMDNVKRILLQNFIGNIESSYKKLDDHVNVKKTDGTYVSVSNAANNMKESIIPYVEALKKQYDKIDEELPSYIKNMETYGDYFKLFTQNDFKIEKKK